MEQFEENHIVGEQQVWKLYKLSENKDNISEHASAIRFKYSQQYISIVVQNCI